MDKSCNIYYNRQNRKWEFYEVTSGKETPLPCRDLQGLKDGDGTKISWEHLVGIKDYINLPEIDINIYEDTPELIADIQNPIDKSIHIKFLRNEFMRKKAKEIEDLFPNFTLTEFIKGEDKEDIRFLKYAVSLIESIIKNIEDRESRAYRIISDTTERIKKISKSDSKHYKDILEQSIKNLLRNISIHVDNKEDVELLFNKCISSALKDDSKVIDTFLKTNLTSVEVMPGIDIPNPTMKEIYALIKSMFASATPNPIMKDTVAGIYGITFFASPIVAFIILSKYKKDLVLKQMQTMQKFWVSFCKQLKNIMEERQSALMEMIYNCSAKEAYDKLKAAKNIINNLH